MFAKLGDDFERTVLFRFAEDAFCWQVAPPRNKRWWELFRESDVYHKHKEMYLHVLVKDIMLLCGNDLEGAVE